MMSIPPWGVVAQLVEQRTLNPKRVGSSPTGPTKLRGLTR
jgi:hypothetical protein